MMPAIKKAFDFNGRWYSWISKENETLKKHIGDYDEKRLEESKAKLLKEIDNDKRVNLIMFRIKKR